MFFLNCKCFIVFSEQNVRHFACEQARAVNLDYILNELKDVKFVFYLKYT